MQDGLEWSPGDLYSAAQARAIDARAIGQGGIAGYILMQRAAAAALQALRARWSAARDLLVFCGAGNNGGDGYVLARDALRQGFRVQVVAAVDPAALTGDAATAAKDCVAAGVPVLPLSGIDLSAICAAADVIVDALLGTGLKSAVREPLAAVIGAINDSARPVLALDVPSGLCADTGRVQGLAVRAALTVTFIVDKTGLWLAQGPEYAGECRLATLDLAAMTLAETPVIQRLSATRLRRRWQRRAREAHKGHAGHVMVLGGAEGMPGAARLAAEAALAGGAGRVTVLCAPASVTAIAAGRAEVMVSGVARAADAEALLARADVVALGPGLGLTDWSRELFSLAISLQTPMVIDADALSLLAELGGDSAGDALGPRPAWVLTPHPGEAARLLQTETRAIQADRLAALRALCARYPGVTVLKGAGTLIGEEAPVDRSVKTVSPPACAICTEGNPAMATAGMGDVLTGVVAALLAQGGTPWEAACTGVWLHAQAGDEAARARGIDRGLLASQLLDGLPSIWGRLLGIDRASGWRA